MNFRLQSPDELVVSNMALVNYIIKKMSIKSNPVYDYDDIFQIGTMGLIKAANTYNGSTKFSTYACICITNEINMFFRKNKNKTSSISLQETMYNDGESKITYGDMIVDDRDDFEKEFINLSLLEDIFSITLNRFSSKQALVMIYLLTNMKQKDIGEKFNISQSAASRIIQNGRNKIISLLNMKQNYPKKYYIKISSDNYEVSFICLDKTVLKAIINKLREKNILSLKWYVKNGKIYIKTKYLTEFVRILSCILEIKNI